MNKSSSGPGIAPVVVWLLHALCVGMTLAGSAWTLAWLWHHDASGYCSIIFGIGFAAAMTVQALVSLGGR